MDTYRGVATEVDDGASRRGWLRVDFRQPVLRGPHGSLRHEPCRKRGDVAIASLGDDPHHGIVLRVVRRRVQAGDVCEVPVVGRNAGRDPGAISMLVVRQRPLEQKRATALHADGPTAEPPGQAAPGIPRRLCQDRASRMPRMLGATGADRPFASRARGRVDADPPAGQRLPQCDRGGFLPRSHRLERSSPRSWRATSGRRYPSPHEALQPDSALHPVVVGRIGIYPQVERLVLQREHVAPPQPIAVMCTVKLAFP